MEVQGEDGNVFNRPEAHPEVQGGDESMCPHLQMMKKKGEKDEEDKSKKEDAESSDSDISSDEEDKPQGGCPVMNNKNAKDPRLEAVKPGFDVPYISPLKSLLGFKGFLGIGEEVNFSRKKWNGHPTYLKHTVFYQSKDYDKARKLEIGHKLFFLDKFKVKGNKYYKKGKYEKAITMYEKGISFLEWLSCDLSKSVDPFEDRFHSDLFEKVQKKDKFDESDIEELKTKFRVDSDVESVLSSGGSEEKKEEKKLSDKEIFDKLILTTFHDGNITYHNGEELVEAQQKDMRNSMLLTLYLNIASCYMRMNHFQEARVMIDQALVIAPTNSIVLYTSAQCRVSNLESNYSHLDTALEELAKAEESKKTEKIFQHKEGILKMIGLDKHVQAFSQLKRLVENRKTELKIREKELTEIVVKRVQELNQIEQRIIDEGKIPEEGPSMYRMFGSEDENMEHFILNEMLKKYLEVMNFYIDSQETKNYKQAKKEYLMHKEIVTKFNFFWEFKLEDHQEIIEELGSEYKIDFNKEKYQKRLLSSMKDKGFEIFEGGQFNLELFQYIVEQYFKNKEEEMSKEAENGMFEETGSLNTASAKAGKHFNYLTTAGSIAASFIVFGIGAYFFQNYLSVTF